MTPGLEACPESSSRREEALHRFCFRENLSLVTSAATGSGVFQRAVSLSVATNPSSRFLVGRRGGHGCGRKRIGVSGVPSPSPRPLPWGEGGHRPGACKIPPASPFALVRLGTKPQLSGARLLHRTDELGATGHFKTSQAGAAKAQPQYTF